MTDPLLPREPVSLSKFFFGEGHPPPSSPCLLPLPLLSPSWQLLVGAPLCSRPLPPCFVGFRQYHCLNILITAFNYVNPRSHFPS